MSGASSYAAEGKLTAYQGDKTSNPDAAAAAVVDAAAADGGDDADGDDVTRLLSDLGRSCRCARGRGRWTCNCAPNASRRMRDRRLLGGVRGGAMHRGNRWNKSRAEWKCSDGVGRDGPVRHRSPPSRARI